MPSTEQVAREIGAITAWLALREWLLSEEGHMTLASLQRQIMARQVTLRGELGESFRVLEWLRGEVEKP